MNSKKIKIITIILSLGVFIASLTQNAVVTLFNDKTNITLSWEYFLMGAISFLGGGLSEEIIWLANPLSLLAIFYLVTDKEGALVLSLLALFLAISFSSWSEILVSESGSMAKIVSLELGYFLWISSILILTIGIWINNKVLLNTPLED